MADTTTPITDSNRTGPNNLTEDEAAIRSKQVSNVNYKFHLKLTKSSTTYKGDFTITLDYSPVKDAKELFLDFVGKQIDTLKINQKIVSDNVWSGNRIHIGSLLQAGTNVVHIIYTNNYDHTGDGFHQFTDPEDNQEYLYTNFEPFECHRLIPCFDQPNIKAHYTLSVDAPSDWEVITNVKEEKAEPTVNEKDSTTHFFSTTPLMSSYLFAVVAGPYDKEQDIYDNRVPLRIYIRKSLKKYLDKDNIFTQTKQGLAFYENFFDFKYPFQKYDQLFVPEFNVGAMENIGCVTFTEGYIYKEPPTTNQLANRADTILHEMAHMWFGDLVTPVWWNGLWLNESFATYMAALCVASATKFGDLSWLVFNSGMKQWAYREDQLCTTHPIEGKVIDTDATVLIFDGITYGKGASLLKQLVFLLGMDNFKSGMRYYFKKYAWGNTTIAQFLEALASVTDRLDPVAWAQEWLQTAGLNSLQLHYTLQDGKIASAFVEQGCPAPQHSTLRHHTTEVGLYDLVDGLLKLRETVIVRVQPQALTEVKELVGKQTPVFSFVNNNDHAFAKCPLDSTSLEFVLSNLSKISDPLLRQLLWNLLYDLTRDAKMKATDYIKLVVSFISIENDPKLVQTILSRATSALVHFIPENKVDDLADMLFSTVFSLAQSAPKEGEFRIIWARYSVEFARTAKSVAVLGEELKKDNPLFTQDLRWGIVVRLAAWESSGASEALEHEKTRDKSDTGVRAAIRASTSVPNMTVKNEAWEKFINPESKQSVHQLAAAMCGFHWRHQRALLAPFTEKFFSSVRNVFKTREKEFCGSFFHNLFPYDPNNKEITEKAKQLFAQLQPEEKHLRKVLEEELDDIARSERCIAFDQQ